MSKLKATLSCTASCVIIVIYGPQKTKRDYFKALFSQSSHLPVSLLKALRLQVNICSKGMQSMQESRGMGGAPARLCVEDSFSSRLKALTKLSSARKSWLGQIRRNVLQFISQNCMCIQSLKTTVQLLVFMYVWSENYWLWLEMSLRHHSLERFWAASWFYCSVTMLKCTWAEWRGGG